MQFDPGCWRLSNDDLRHDYGLFHAGLPTRLISYAKTVYNFTIDGAIRHVSTQHLPGECFPENEHDRQLWASSKRSTSRALF
jgi:hypothetical protein